MIKKIKDKCIFVFSLVFLFCFLLVSGVGAESGEWNQFQNDAQNSGVTYESGPMESVEKGWKGQAGTDDAGMGAGVNCTPLVAEGKVFAIGAKGVVHAFDAKTGLQLWESPLSCTNQQFQLVNPAYAEGKLFVGTNDGWVYALNGSDGTIIWEKRAFEHKYSQMYTPINYDRGKIYLGSWNGDNSYYCFAADTGELVWQRKAAPGNLGYYWAGACVAGDFLILGDMNYYLTCLDRNTGALISQINLKTIDPETLSSKGKINASVSYNPEKEKLYFSDESGICWSFNLNEETGALSYAWHQKLDQISNSTPAFYGDRIYVGTGTYASAGNLYCLDEATGNEIWKFTPTGTGEFSVPGIQSSPALSIQGDQIFIYFLSSCETGKLYCLDGNGNKLWEYRSEETGTHSYTTSSVAVSDGWLYFGNDGGFVYGMKGKDVQVDLPDLKVESITIEGESPKVGDLSSVVAVVYNEGNLDTTEFSVNLYEGSETEKIATFQVDSLGVGSRIPISLDWTPKNAGGIMLKVIADPEDQVEESNQDNNVLSSIFSVIPASGGSGGTSPTQITVHLEIQDMYGDTRFDKDIMVNSGANVISVLQAAQKIDKNIKYKYDPNNPHVFGGFVWSLYGIDAPWGEQSDGWVLLVNDKMTNVGAGKVTVYEGDHILWSWGDMTGANPKEKEAAPGSGSQEVQETVPNVNESALVEKEINQNRFTDLPENHWAKDVIENMVAKGYLTGYPDGSCRPNSPVTRAEFATLLVRILELSMEPGKDVFQDVPKNKWYFNAVTTAYEKKLIQGFTEKEFRPDEKITREQTAVMLKSALAYKGKNLIVGNPDTANKLASYKDREQISSWSNSALTEVTQQGLMGGFPDDTFRPKDSATRAQCAVMLMRLLDI